MRDTRKGLTVLSTIGPAALWLVIFLLVPLVLVVVVSFATRDVYGGVKYAFTVGNYTRLLNPLYFKILVQTVYVSLLTTLICLVLGYPFAYYVAQSPPRLRTLLLMLVIIPFWTNLLIRIYAWMVILRAEGLLNTFLMSLGIIDQPLSLLYNQGAVLLGMVYGYLPFMVLPLYASIEKLDHSLLEAANDLGARPAESFLKVTLPLTVPGVVAGSILVFIPAMGMFFIPNILGGSKAMLIGNLIENQFKQARNWPFGAGASIVLMIISLVMIWAYVKIFGFDSEEGVL